jgi:hypothetical protein
MNSKETFIHDIRSLPGFEADTFRTLSKRNSDAETGCRRLRILLYLQRKFSSRAQTLHSNLSINHHE